MLRSKSPPCSPSELKRFKVVLGIVATLSGVVLLLIMMFGDASRSYVDRVNLFLGPIVVITACIFVYGLWRFRRACIAWREEKHSVTPV
jgi:hypothetical protein